MDAAGFERAVVFGISEGGSMSALFAATYPARTSALVLYGAFAKRLQSDDYPWAPSREERQKWIDFIESSGVARSTWILLLLLSPTTLHLGGATRPT